MKKKRYLEIKDNSIDTNRTGHIKYTIEKLLKTLGIGPDIELLFRTWDKCIGNLTKHVELKEVDKNILTVVIKHPIARQEFLLRKNEIVKEINKQFNKKRVKDIFIVNDRGVYN